MNILVTGAAGFIGSHLIDRLLLLGHKVIAIDNLSWGNLKFISIHKTNHRFRFHKLDLLDKKNLSDSFDHTVDVVFHLAANSDIARSSQDTEIDLKNTTLATYNLLEALKIHGIKYLIYTSGSGVYGDWGNKRVSESSAPLLPVSMYGATKLSAEAMISAFAHLFGIQASILRPANIIGSRPTHGVIHDLINKLKKNPHRLEILGDGKQNKSYIHIEDFLDAMHLVWKKAKQQINIYNIATDDSLTVNEIASLIIKEMKLKNVKITRSKNPIGWPGDIPLVKIDNTAIKKLGWKNKYTTKEAVVKTIQEILKSS